MNKLEILNKWYEADDLNLNEEEAKFFDELTEMFYEFDELVSMGSDYYNYFNDVHVFEDKEKNIEVSFMNYVSTHNYDLSELRVKVEEYMNEDAA